MSTTALQDFQRRFKGVATAKLIDTLTQAPFHVPNCAFVFNPGQEIETLELSNAVGSNSYAGFTLMADKPSIELTFSHNPAEVLEMIFGYKFEVETNVIGEYTKEFTIQADGTVPAVAAGELGETIIADDPGVSISVLDADFNYTLPLTRVDLVTGVTAPTEYTVGAGGELTFDSTLANKNGSMVVSTTFTQVMKKSETPIGTYDFLSTLVIADSHKVALMSAKNCEVQLGSAQFNPKSPETNIQLMPIPNLGKCSSYDFMYIPAKVAG